MNHCGRRSLLCMVCLVMLSFFQTVSGAATAQQAAGQANSEEVMSRGNRQRSGAYATQGPVKLKGMAWKSPQIFSLAIKPTTRMDVYRPPGGGQWITLSRSGTIYPGADFSSPLIAGGMLFFTLELDNGHLIALDQATGQRMWTYKAERHSLTLPAVAGGLVYVGSSDGILHALNAQTGQEAWQFKAEDYRYAFGSPVVADGVVYFDILNKNDKGEVYALDIQTHQPRWVFQEKMYVSSPAIGADTIYFCTSTDFLVAVDVKSGKEKWRLKSKTGPPAYVDGTVYFSDSKTISAVDAGTGKLKWRTDANGLAETAMAIADDTIWYTGWYDSLYAVDAQTGREKWKFKTKAPCHAPIVAGGIVYIGGADLYAVDGKTGELKWKIDGEKTYVSTPAVANGKIYVVRSDGHVYSFY
jgi:outer membrane protein assembly factor BamB